MPASRITSEIDSNDNNSIALLFFCFEFRRQLFRRELRLGGGVGSCHGSIIALDLREMTRSQDGFEHAAAHRQRLV